jgi:hypothetical protein
MNKHRKYRVLRFLTSLSVVYLIEMGCFFASDSRSILTAAAIFLQCTNKEQFTKNTLKLCGVQELQIHQKLKGTVSRYF